MSTCYRCYDKTVSMVDFLAALPALNMSLDVGSEQTDTAKVVVLPNGCYMHVSTEDGSDVDFARFGGNDVDEAIEAIGEHFDVEIVDEYDERYFEGEDECDGEEGEPDGNPDGLWPLEV